MENSQNSAAFEAQLHDQIGQIGRQISKLVAEREALKRVLVRLYNDQALHHTLQRPKGHQQLVVETRILDIFRAAEGAPVSCRDLLADLRKAHPELKDATFRTYLHRLQKRSLIAPQQGLRGHWRFVGEGGPAA